MNGIQHTATRKDVAREAGVSETIVSYVLNNNRPVSAEKRQRVLDAVRKLNYRPNAIARALKGKGNSHILFIADNIATEYFARLIQELNAIAYDRGYIVSLMETVNSEEFVSRILSRQVDGVVISSTALNDSYIQALIDSGLPTVLLMVRDYEALTGRFARIYTGIEEGIAAAVDYMLKENRQEIVYVDRVSANHHFSDLRDPRYRGFTQQMNKAGITPLYRNYITGCRNMDDLYAAVTEYVTELDADSFICRNDRIACTVLRAVRDSGRQVPRDVAVIGFDDSELARFSSPQLSSIRHDQKHIAAAILSQLEALIAGKSPKDKRYNTKLILRETT
ncbi:MAG: LacI family DNA-binding transcriptional regulator [Clostridia bacterium]|nr:LacI family DNA-binding transcriptional regulator [Clostridia bacterium]